VFAAEDVEGACSHYVEPVRALKSASASGGVTVKRTKKNTVVFNHRDLTAQGREPYVLEVGDGESFQVLFTCTAPEFFNYTMSGDTTTQPDSANATALPEFVSVTSALTTRGMTMRHDSRFPKYRVPAKVRGGVIVPQAPRQSPALGVSCCSHPRSRQISKKRRLGHRSRRSCNRWNSTSGW
jgi:hypothetical protein